MSDVARPESTALAAIRSQAPFQQRSYDFCIHAVMALLGGVDARFVCKYFSIWPMLPSYEDIPQCILCAVNGETDCILVSHFQNRSRGFNRLHPVLPADAAMRLDAEDELYGKIEDLRYHMLLPRCDANAHYVGIWLDDKLQDVRECLAQHKTLLTVDTVSLYEMLYEDDNFTGRDVRPGEPSLLGPLARLDTEGFKRDLRRVRRVVRVMRLAIRNHSAEGVRAYLAGRGNLKAWEGLWETLLKAAWNGGLAFEHQPYYMYVQLYPLCQE